MSDDVAHPATQLAWATAEAMRQGRFVEARVACEEALRLQLEARTEAGVASVRTTLGRLHLLTGDLVGAEEALREALAAHQRHGSGRLVALSQRYLAEVLLERGDVGGAELMVGNALMAFARSKETNLEADAQLQLAAIHHAAGNLAGAVQFAGHVRGVAQGIPDAGLLGQALLRLAQLQVEVGRRAEPLLEEATAAFAEVDDVPGRLAVVHLHLRADLEAGRPDPAAARRLVEHLSPSGDPFAVGSAASTLGAHLALAGDADGARAVFADATALLAHHPLRTAEVTLDEGVLDVARGERGAALARLGAVPDEALNVVSVRLRLRALRSLATAR